MKRVSPELGCLVAEPAGNWGLCSDARLGKSRETAPLILVRDIWRHQRFWEIRRQEVEGGGAEGKQPSVPGPLAWPPSQTLQRSLRCRHVGVAGTHQETPFSGKNRESPVPHLSYTCLSSNPMSTSIYCPKSRGQEMPG